MSEDETTLTKIYTENTKDEGENVIVMDLAGNVTPINILSLILQIVVGDLVYFASLAILRDKFLFEAIKNVIDRIRKR